MLITADTPYCHGITVCDETGQPISRVQKFDTETYLCWLPNGKRAMAAAYAIFPADEEHLRRCLDSLPDSMQEHVYPAVCAGSAPDDTEKQQRQKFIFDQLNHRTRLRSLVASK